jgi:membrane protein YdbS with pleckstrin-like domain
VALTADIALDGTEHPLDPRMRTVWTVGPSAVWIVAFGGLSAAAAISGSGAAAGVLAVAGVVLVGVSAGWARLRWARWRWRAFADALEVRHGVVNQKISLVPYHRIQQIDVRRGPVERLLGLSSLILRTAAATTDAEVPGISAEHADALRLALLHRAGIDDAV